MSNIVRDLLLCMALGLIVYGAYLAHPAAGSIVGGLFLFGVIWSAWTGEVGK